MTTPSYSSELLAIAQWIEDDAVGEDQEIADYARHLDDFNAWEKEIAA